MNNEIRLKRLESIKKIKSRKTNEDVIGAILFYVHDEVFNSDPELIHRAIKDCKDKGEYAPFLKDFIFTKDRVFPRSELLDNIFNNFQNSTFIGMKNPRYGEYFFYKNSKKVLEERILSKFDTDERKYLKEMGEIFNSYVELKK